MKGFKTTELFPWTVNPTRRDTKRSVRSLSIRGVPQSLFSVQLSSADDTGCRYILPGPDNVAYGFVFISNIIICRLDKLTLADRLQVTLQLRISVSGLV